MNDSILTQPIKIAVIDDNAEFAIGIKILLSKEGVEIHTAGDGIEGLKMVRELLPDISWMFMPSRRPKVNFQHFFMM